MILTNGCVENALGINGQSVPHMPMIKLFISQSTQDDNLVRDLRQALEALEQPVRINLWEVRGGDLLWSSIQQTIELGIRPMPS